MSTQDKISFSKMRSAFFLGLIIVFTIAIMYLVRPFFYPVFWAAVTAILFYPHYNWLNNFLRMPGLSATIMLVVVTVTLFLPLVLVGTFLVNESLDVYNNLNQGNLTQNVQGISSFLEHTPLAPYLDTIKTEWPKYAADITGKINAYVFASVKEVTQNSLKFFLMLFIMLYTLFYFFKDGEKILLRLMHLSPLGDTYEKMLYERFTSTARATLKGTLVVGLVQGALGGILFWITGIPAAFIWGLVMAIMSLLPAFGTAVVWLPAGLIMLALGNTWQGVTILVAGAFVIGLVDNLLRPPLVGKDTQMHPLLVLFSTLGGIALFGISGFIIGPVIASLYLAIMSIYDHYYRTELEVN